MASGAKQSCSGAYATGLLRRYASRKDGSGIDETERSFGFVPVRQPPYMRNDFSLRVTFHGGF